MRFIVRFTHVGRSALRQALLGESVLNVGVEAPVIGRF
jgi:hypothetical protein